MANRTPTVTRLQNGDLMALWEGLAGDGDDVGLPVEVPPGTRSICAHVFGTFGNDGSFSIQGSNTGVAAQFITMKTKEMDADSAVAATVTAAALLELLELPRYVRILQNEGEAAVTDVDVSMIFRQ